MRLSNHFERESSAWFVQRRLVSFPLEEGVGNGTLNIQLNVREKYELAKES